MVNRIPVATPAKRRKDAQRLIERFTDNFSMAHRELAKYAAVALVLTPELVNHLRSRFLRKVPWIAEADLLLSELCVPAGYEQYVMDADVRACLVEELEVQSPQAVEAVARDLIRYVKYLQKTNRYLTDNEQQRQQWSAMGCITEQRSQLAEELLMAFDRNIAGVSPGEWDGALTNRSELAWLVDVTKDLASKLKEHRNLIQVCERVNHILQDARSSDQVWLAQSLQERVPAEDSTAAVTGEDILPDLQEFEFEFAEYVEEGDVLNPQLQTFEFDIITFVEEPLENLEPDPLVALNWQRVRFTVATIGSTVTISPNQKSKLLTAYHAAWMYTAEVKAPRRVLRKGSTVQFEMMAIPGGEFSMGSDSEKPIHPVKVPPFFMGKYPVTQKLWSAVAQMPRVNRDMERDPANFKGDDKPVEQVSWLDAMEFCARLSKHMGREYRLPTEAEWEYACRAGTTTEYHFGDSITSELVNYGQSNSGTTPVGQFPYFNAFGLSDMYGNVWEWCMDHWHDSYKGAPSDGSAWIDAKANEDAPRLLRGGSWDTYPAACRSASRLGCYPDDRYNLNIGFRLVSPARILP
jgi:formylglycine-generating enzyme required for sulfatase activity